MSKSRKRHRKTVHRPGKGRSRRVLLQRTAGMDSLGSRDESAPAQSERLALSAYHFKTHPIVRLTAAGIDWGVAPDCGDEIGYCMQPYRGDDCLQAAVATCAQVPIEQIPDLNLAARFERGESQDEMSTQRSPAPSATFTRADTRRREADTSHVRCPGAPTSSMRRTSAKSMPSRKRWTPRREVPNLNPSTRVSRVASQGAPALRKQPGAWHRRNTPSTRSAIYPPSSPESGSFQTRRRPIWLK